MNWLWMRRLLRENPSATWEQIAKKVRAASREGQGNG